MNITEEISIALVNALEIVFRDILIFLPKILLAFVILAVLIWVGKIVSKLIGDLLRLIRIDQLLSRIGVTQAFHAVGFQVSIAYAVQTFIKWILILIALLSAFAILGLDEVVFFLEYGIFQILPNIAILALMLFLTIVAANKGRDLMSHSSFVARHHSPFLANLVWFIIILFGVITTLQELDILRFITDAVAGIIQALGLGLALALGLAFGLGCKEEARCLIRSWMGKDCYDLDCGCGSEGLSGASHDHDCDCDNCSIK